MNYYGDVKIYHTDDGGKLIFHGGQPDMDGGLWTSVYLSLFTDRGWWGDPAIGSNLGLLDDSTLTNATRINAIEEAKRALAWLKDKGIASDIEVDAEIPGAGMLALLITISEPGKMKTENRRYEIPWRNQREAL
jgi:phage gp46-like protein